MGDKTGIEWTDATWSPVTGCTRVSDGCLNCYIERSTPIRVAGRKFDGEGIGASLAVQLHPNRLDWPLRKRDGKKIFVCSQADLFHDDVPDEYIARVFAVMALSPHHTFQVLTKRHGRMRSLLNSHAFWGRVGVAGLDRDVWLPQSGVSLDQHYLPNVWLGVSAEDQKRAELRIPALYDTPAAVRFVSAEPLLGLIDTTTSGLLARDEFDRGIDWVIVGGESGPGARPMHPWWAESLHRQCVAAGVPFLFKQWGDWTPMAPLKNGRFDFSNGIAMTDDGNTYNAGDLDWPDGPRRGEAIRADFPHHRPTSMYRVGKKAAGRELYHDGRTFDGYPQVLA
ncbi:DUF5131 family protein [Mycobacteroides abscessus]|uniref:DUF5131 family protein n=1 Tax=Mycobacteroides abscessus TaxID=36809 RepID=UPI00092CA045|nr:phage Gp37/Gp68 family protein [Mycobacteroides abscessus]PVB03160.1 phage Gp37/Gp68 family protein [Mycobacteroides abscessus]SIJ20609.1 bacteriophage protein gp37 [Mycobacteroides abscessus subsp. abscessus]SKF73566.1 bacteriophage protein gp37 [Mycobacteroides abscessus subsp. massiliense]